MKHLHCTLCILALLIIASCSSDNGANTKIDQDEGYYTLNFSIKVSDDEGNNLLSVPGEENISFGYSRSDIHISAYYINSVNYIDYSDYYIARNNENEVLLNVKIKGKYLRWEYPFEVAQIYWGWDWRTVDRIECELRKDGDEIKCTKIWFNGELKWDIENSDLPVFSIVKKHNDLPASLLPPAEPIVLKYPEKIKTDNQFAFNLFKKAIAEDLNADKPNTFISPLSVSLVLNMLINGAEGETKDEIKAALEANDYSIDQINEHSKELREALISVDPSTSILIANSIWPSIELPIKEDFIQTNANYYDAVVFPIDFTSPDAIRTVNNWCYDKTKGMIPEVLGEFSDDVMLLLINALYFKSDWRSGNEFAKESTRKESFYSTDGSNNTVDMMRRTSYYLYKSDTDAGYLKLLFGNRAYSMVIILPHEDSSIQTVINNIDKNSSWTTSGSMTSRMVNLSLPKFKMDFSYKMNEYILPEMGMRIPFSRNFADFREISDFPSYVSRIVHKTAIEVNEAGVAASAITIVEGGAASDGSEPPIPIDFRVNRPFIFSICEESTGAILFIGKIEKL